MFNPYFHEPVQMLERKNDTVHSNPIDVVFQRIGQLDSDDLLLLLLIFILFKDGKRDNMWPLMAALVYCML